MITVEEAAFFSYYKLITGHSYLKFGNKFLPISLQVFELRSSVPMFNAFCYAL
jgi:hypothetical protein